MRKEKKTIRLVCISKTYKRIGGDIKALRNISLEIADNEFLAIWGASGSGKTTLLNIMGGLDVPDEGEIIIGEKSLSKMSERELTLFRRRQVGFVFQFFNLFGHLTVRQNVAVPFLLDGYSLREIGNRVKEMIDAVGLMERLDHFPHQLSGGEMQRVAIARALITEPEIVLADEPTGNLDSQMSRLVVDLMSQLAKKYKKTVIMVTHDQRAANIADRLIELSDGRIVNDGYESGP